jgi:fructoselysine 6-kinase
VAVEPSAVLAAVGDNCIDRYVPAVRPDTVGGNALNVAVGLVKAGYPTMYLGAVGDDSEGRIIVDSARAAGVDVRALRVLDAPTGVTTVELRSDGDRVFLEEKYGASELYSVDDRDLELLTSCSWIHAANLTDAVTSIRSLAERGQPVSYDFSDRGDSALRARLCPYLDVAFFSAPMEDDAEATSLANAALRDGARLAVVTRGAVGSLALANGERFEQSALAVDAVDTLGAGDAFIAAFIAAQLEGVAVPNALRRGAESAAETCEMIGPWPVAKEGRT